MCSLLMETTTYTTFGGKGEAHGKLNFPHGLHIDKNDSLYACMCFRKWSNSEAYK